MLYIINHCNKIINKIKHKIIYAFEDVFNVSINDEILDQYSWDEKEVRDYFNNVQDRIRNKRDDDLKIPYKKNAYWSNKTTSLFKSTKINVYEFDCEYPTAYTIPGRVSDTFFEEKITGIYELLWVLFILSRVGFILPLVLRSLMVLAVLKSSLKNAFKDNYNDLSIKIDPISKKIECSIPEVTIVTTSALLETKFTDNEIIATILHELGHNAQTRNYVINTFIYEGLMTRRIIGILTFLLTYIYTARNVNWDNNNHILKSIMVVLTAYAMTALVLSALTYRDTVQEYRSDDFAVKCGFGPDLKSALIKLYAFEKTYLRINQHSPNVLVSIFRILERVISAIIKIITLHPATEEHPNRYDRITNIDNKIKEYNDAKNRGETRFD